VLFQDDEDELEEVDIDPKIQGESDQPTIFYFVVDRSGSMSG
jgi:hypothetical protein